MKTATWADGTETVRKTHTKDYKFAYRATNINGHVEVGFSTTKKGAETGARSLVNWNLKTARELASLKTSVNDFNYSEKGLELIAKTKEALQKIEIVEVY